MTTNGRPKIRPSWTGADKILALAATAGVLLLLGAVLFAWQQLPERIPAHFGITGEPDAWGSKGSIMILPAVGLILYASMMALARVPHVYNYPVKITEANAEAQYRLGRRLLLTVNAFTIWLLAGLLLNSIAVAMGRQEGLSPVLLIVLLVAPAGILIGYLILASRRDWLRAPAGRPASMPTGKTRRKTG